MLKSFFSCLEVLLMTLCMLAPKVVFFVKLMYLKIYMIRHCKQEEQAGD